MGRTEIEYPEVDGFVFDRVDTQAFMGEGVCQPGKISGELVVIDRQLQFFETKVFVYKPKPKDEKSYKLLPVDAGHFMIYNEVAIVEATPPVSIANQYDRFMGWHWKDGYCSFYSPVRGVFRQSSGNYPLHVDGIMLNENWKLDDADWCDYVGWRV